MFDWHICSSCAMLKNDVMMFLPDCLVLINLLCLLHVLIMKISLNKKEAAFFLKFKEIEEFKNLPCSSVHLISH